MGAAGEPGPGRPRQAGAAAAGELFFDLVFAFTITQLTALLTSRPLGTGLIQVVLIFGLLWWMYAGHPWLTNTRAPVRAAERLLLLVRMAGFLTAGLAIPYGFGRYGLAFGAATWSSCSCTASCTSASTATSSG